MQRTAGRGFLRRGLQICEALRRLCRHHVVASVECSCKRLPAEILDRSDRWLALPVLKKNWVNTTLRNWGPVPAGSSCLKRVIDAGPIWEPQVKPHLAICLTREIECKITNRFRSLRELRLRSLAHP